MMHTRRDLLRLLGAAGAMSLSGGLSAATVDIDAGGRGIAIFTDHRRLALEADADVLLAPFGTSASLASPGREPVGLKRAVAHSSPEPAQYVSACVDSHGHIVLLDRRGRRLDRFLPDGRFVDTLSLQSPCTSPAQACWHAGEFWIADSGRHQVLRLRPGNAPQVMFGGDPTRRDSLNGPTSLAIDASGNVHVLEVGHHRISVWTPGGRPLGEYAGDLTAGARGLAMDARSGQAIVLDGWQQLAVVYNSGSGSELFRSSPLAAPAPDKPLKSVSFTMAKGFYISS